MCEVTTKVKEKETTQENGMPFLSNGDDKCCLIASTNNAEIVSRKRSTEDNILV
jgi:hypothetical protein